MAKKPGGRGGQHVIFKLTCKVSGCIRCCGSSRKFCPSSESLYSSRILKIDPYCTVRPLQEHSKHTPIAPDHSNQRAQRNDKHHETQTSNRERHKPPKYVRRTRRREHILESRATEGAAKLIWGLPRCQNQAICGLSDPTSAGSQELMAHRRESHGHAETPKGSSFVVYMSMPRIWRHDS